MTFADQIPILRPLANDEERKRLERAALADGHLVWGANWLIEKGGEIAGYIGLNSVPTFQGWFHTERIKARDSALIFAQVEGQARFQGWRHLLLMLPDTSPFAGRSKDGQTVIQRFGYQHLANAGLHLKKL